MKGLQKWHFATEPAEAAKLILGRISRGVACHTMLFVFTPWGFPHRYYLAAALTCLTLFFHTSQCEPQRLAKSRTHSTFFCESSPPTPYRRFRTTHVLISFPDTPTHSIRPGVGRPPELAPWRGPGGALVRRTASLVPTLPSSGPGRLVLAFLRIYTPTPARGQVGRV
ncbi:hypothetical protein RSOLAG1IB_12121 [Rhizoctonia solani AG-1 IB]|uniref:Uncharacterized protein n=1 Tax=Thanatephorus cucumeris (strain AG1-IB / isolate 7/3/14) TaxID=1108050 RepID=A0A0B7FI18_THACB|nr:hypothetical protein RSOLAG1IB_12121 [Rhizoctonia solani AG-1 IB]